MFQRFTERARQVVVLAQDEARALDHDYIGTEHLLLGLLRAEDGLAARALQELGADAGDVERRVVEVVGRGGHPGHTGQIPFAPRAKQVLELALREALSLGHNYIGTEHILLGLVRLDEGAAARILLDLDLDADRIRETVMSALGDPEIHRRPGAARRVWFGTSHERPRWEYHIAEREPIEAAWLNELGAAGWELVDVSGARCVFKRRCAPPGELRAAG